MREIDDDVIVKAYEAVELGLEKSPVGPVRAEAAGEALYDTADGWSGREARPTRTRWALCAHSLHLR
jgi:hypothetical protein